MCDLGVSWASFFCFSQGVVKFFFTEWLNVWFFGTGGKICIFSFLSSFVKLEIIGEVFCGLNGSECFTNKASGFTTVLSFNSFGIVKKRLGLLMNFKLSWNLT